MVRKLSPRFRRLERQRAEREQLERRLAEQYGALRVISLAPPATKAAMARR